MGGGGQNHPMHAFSKDNTVYDNGFFPKVKFTLWKDGKDWKRIFCSLLKMMEKTALLKQIIKTDFLQIFVLCLHKYLLTQTPGYLLDT